MANRKEISRDEYEQLKMVEKELEREILLIMKMLEVNMTKLTT